MWFRYSAITLLKWLTVNAVIVASMFLVLPDSWRGDALAAPIWIMTFLVSTAFAYWALSKKAPNWKDVLKLMGIWLLVTLVLQNAFELFVIGRAFFIMLSLESMIGYFVELLGVIVAAILVRWRLAGKAKSIVAGI